MDDEDKELTMETEDLHQGKRRRHHKDLDDSDDDGFHTISGKEINAESFDELKGMTKKSEKRKRHRDMDVDDDVEDKPRRHKNYYGDSDDDKDYYKYSEDDYHYILEKQQKNLAELQSKAEQLLDAQKDVITA